MTDCDKPFQMPPPIKPSDVPADLVRVRDLSERQREVVTNLAKGEVAFRKEAMPTLSFDLDTKRAEGKGFIRRSDAKDLESLYAHLDTPEKLQQAGYERARQAEMDFKGLGGVSGESGAPSYQDNAKKCGTEMVVSGVIVNTEPHDVRATTALPFSTAILAAKNADVSIKLT